ncbi:MAG: TraB/GumN family protein [Saprospiraceae bacterium]|nr:TraB/GumN family protein [Saprospiraceae bacterium]
MGKVSSLLWQFSDQNNHQGYLFGSIHLALPNQQSLLDALEPYIRECNLVLNEVNFEFLQSSDISSYIQMKEGLSYQNLLSPKKWTKLYNVLHKYLGDEIHLDFRQKPVVLLNLLSCKVAGFSLDDQHLDGVIYQLARRLKIPASGLEEFERHYSYLDRIPLEDQMRGLVKAGNHISDLRRKIRKIILAYLNQDIHLLYRISKSQLGKWRKWMINERNEEMSEALMQQLGEFKPFICVGAAHLSGKYGMLRILKKRGFQLKPILIKQ